MIVFSWIVAQNKTINFYTWGSTTYKSSFPKLLLPRIKPGTKAVAVVDESNFSLTILYNEKLEYETNTSKA